jgi:hypothetical protein
MGRRRRRIPSYLLVVGLAAFLISLAALGIAAWSLVLSLRREAREAELFQRMKRAAVTWHRTGVRTSSAGGKLYVYEFMNIGAAPARGVGAWWADTRGTRVSGITWLGNPLLKDASRSVEIPYPQDWKPPSGSDVPRLSTRPRRSRHRPAVSGVTDLLSTLRWPVGDRLRLEITWTDESGQHNAPTPMSRPSPRRVTRPTAS